MTNRYILQIIFKELASIIPAKVKLTANITILLNFITKNIKNANEFFNLIEEHYGYNSDSKIYLCVLRALQLYDDRILNYCIMSRSKLSTHLFKLACTTKYFHKYIDLYITNNINKNTGNIITNSKNYKYRFIKILLDNKDICKYIDFNNMLLETSYKTTKLLLENKDYLNLDLNKKIHYCHHENTYLMYFFNCFNKKYKLFLKYNDLNYENRESIWSLIKRDLHQEIAIHYQYGIDVDGYYNCISKFNNIKLLINKQYINKNIKPIIMYCYKNNILFNKKCNEPFITTLFKLFIYNLNYIN